MSRIQSSESQENSVGVRIGVGFLFVCAAVGLVVLLRYGWDVLRNSHLEFHPAAIVIGGWNWFWWFAHDQAAIWITAVATVMLWRATNMLTRATNIEHASNGPLLHIYLEPRPLPPPDSSPVFYLSEYSQADQGNAFFAARSHGLPPQYLWIRIVNVQKAQHGVATNIKLTAVLTFGASDDVAGHPYKIERVATLDVLFADTDADGALFNVAGLPNWVAEVSTVEYADLFKRHRTAAFGNAGLRQTVSGTITARSIVFEPRKNEYTDAT